MRRVFRVGGIALRCPRRRSGRRSYGAAVGAPRAVERRDLQERLGTLEPALAIGKPVGDVRGYIL